MKTLSQCQRELREIDEGIVALCEKRQEAAREMAAVCRAGALPAYDPHREVRLLRSRASMVRDPRNARIIRPLFSVLGQLFRSEQRYGMNVYLVGDGLEERIGEQLRQSAELPLLRADSEASLKEAALAGGSLVTLSRALCAQSGARFLRESGLVILLCQTPAPELADRADLTLDPTDPETPQILWDYCLD